MSNDICYGCLDMKSRTYYTVCPYCGANLDPGERCDCVNDI